MEKNEVLEFLQELPVYRNKKKGNDYIYLGECLNCTNAQDGQDMIVYARDGLLFVREKKEFFEKFEKVME